METTSDHEVTNEMTPRADSEAQHTESRTAVESETNGQQVNPAKDTSLQEEEPEDQVKITWCSPGAWKFTCRLLFWKQYIRLDKLYKLKKVQTSLL